MPLQASFPVFVLVLMNSLTNPLRAAGWVLREWARVGICMAEESPLPSSSSLAIGGNSNVSEERHFHFKSCSLKCVWSGISLSPPLLSEWQL